MDRRQCPHPDDGHSQEAASPRHTELAVTQPEEAGPLQKPFKSLPGLICYSAENCPACYLRKTGPSPVRLPLLNNKQSSPSKCSFLLMQPEIKAKRRFSPQARGVGVVVQRLWGAQHVCFSSLSVGMNQPGR